MRISKVWSAAFCNTHPTKPGFGVKCMTNVKPYRLLTVLYFSFKSSRLSTSWTLPLRTANLLSDVSRGCAPAFMAQTVSRPLSRFHTHPYARRGAFETKMAALKGRCSIVVILPKNRAMWIVQKLNGPISKLFEKVKELCVRLVVYCHRQPEQPANKFVLREPKHDGQNSGRPAISLLSVLTENT